MKTVPDNLQTFLGLKKPVHVKYSKRGKKSADAIYLPHYSNDGKLKAHRITIYMGNQLTRSVLTLYAHELIHAKQEEKGLTEIHGRMFIRWARRLEMEFGLRDIFMLDVDKD